MLLNQDTVVRSDCIDLWPYRKEHVLKYHEWMKDEEIQTLTASEPLSLQEEYEMQTSWQRDADKLTFIVAKSSQIHDSALSLNTCVETMIGDVNLFLSPQDNQSEYSVTQDSSLTTRQEHEEKDIYYNGELELMIAEKSARGQGYGKAALLLFMAWILKHKQHVVLNGTLERFIVKIGADNVASLALFRKIGFTDAKYSEFFREYELHLLITEHTSEDIDSLMRDRYQSWQESMVIETK